MICKPISASDALYTFAYFKIEIITKKLMDANDAFQDY